MPTERRDFIKYLTAGGTATIAGCTGGDGAVGDTGDAESMESNVQEDDEERYGGTLKIAISSEFRTADPRDCDGSGCQMPIAPVYESLIGRDFEGNLIPQLAENWEVVDDTTVELTLREDVTFHNGSPLTSEDVKFSFERFEGGINEPDVFQWYDSIEVQDDHTFTLNLQSAYAPIFGKSGLYIRNIVPRDFVEDEDGDLANNPVGTGPYKFVEWDKGNRFVLERHEDYWQGRPYLDRVEFRIVPEAASQLSALQTGEIHAIDNLLPNSISDVQNNEELRLDSVEALTQTWLVYNVQREPFSNPEVRKAISHAIPREGIVEAVFNNQATPSYGPIPRTLSYYYNEQVEEWGRQFDLETAREQLEEAGYGDGFEIRLVGSNDEQVVQWTQILSSQFQELDIDLTVDTFPWSTYNDIILAEDAPEKFDLVAIGWSGGYDPDIYVGPRVGEEAWAPACCNLNHYSHSRVNELIEEGRTTIEREERKPIYDELQEILVKDELPIDYISIGNEFLAYRRGVNGLRASPDPLYQFRLFRPDIDAAVWLDEDLR